MGLFSSFNVIEAKGLTGDFWELHRDGYKRWVKHTRENITDFYSMTAKEFVKKYWDTAETGDY